jgi:hypothetical protein
VKRGLEYNRGHVWDTYTDGSSDVDMFAYNAGDKHNGPVCVNCGYAYCHHCEDGPQKSCRAVKVKHS